MVLDIKGRGIRVNATLRAIKDALGAAGFSAVEA
jgi:hypothetical protein